MRGKGSWQNEDTGRCGITPAYAGKRLFDSVVMFFVRDHPRICGEKSPVLRTHARISGSPPHMRGKEQAFNYEDGGEGITPAYAGKRAGTRINFYLKRDHPRICGEKSSSSAACRAAEGSPPHMRGKVAVLESKRCNFGITPAYAGKSCTEILGKSCPWDHPRICGEKVFRKCNAVSHLGSPPHMRGKAV